MTPPVGRFPGRFMAHGQLFDRHPAWLKHDMLAVIQFPIPVEDAPLRFQASEQRSARKRSQYREARQIDGRVQGQLHRGIEHLGGVVIQTEDETALYRDAELVQIVDECPVVDGAVEAFAGLF